MPGTVDQHHRNFRNNRDKVDGMNINIALRFAVCWEILVVHSIDAILKS